MYDVVLKFRDGKHMLATYELGAIKATGKADVRRYIRRERNNFLKELGIPDNVQISAKIKQI